MDKRDRKKLLSLLVVPPTFLLFLFWFTVSLSTCAILLAVRSLYLKRRRKSVPLLVAMKSLYSSFVPWASPIDQTAVHRRRYVLLRRGARGRLRVEKRNRLHMRYILHRNALQLLVYMLYMLLFSDRDWNEPRTGPVLNEMTWILIPYRTVKMKCNEFSYRTVP